MSCAVSILSRPSKTPHVHRSFPEDTPPKLIGPDLKTLIGQEVKIRTDGPGTPGVNRRGSLEQDQRNVAQRISDVQKKVGPHAHTEKSLLEYRDRIETINLHVQEWHTLKGILTLHERNKISMKQTFRKQLTAFVVGAGPTGLAACIPFYMRGFKVICFERYAEAKFATREQPFGLQPTSYLALHAWGISSHDILTSLGRQITQKDIDHQFGRHPITRNFLEGLGSNLLLTPLMRDAKEQRIGSQAIDYQPNSPSLRIRDLQTMFFRTIKDLKQIDKQDLSLIFNIDCSAGWAVDTKGRKTCHGYSYDIIYNATGGRINKALGFTMSNIGKYYGMGAFYHAPPTKPDASKISPLLSRAVRVFASFKKDEPIYCNIELSEEEFGSPEKKREIIDMVAHDVGLGTFILSFDVQIDLDNVEEAAKLANGQLTICGGDSLLKPHFMTFSGANFGFLGLIELDRLLDHWVHGEMTEKQLVSEYNQMAKLLQKQSAQMIMNLFAQELL